MLNWRATVRALELPLAKLEKRSERLSGWLLIIFGVLILFCLGSLAFDFHTFLDAWRSNDWSTYSSGIVPITFPLLFVSFLPALWRSAQYSLTSVLQVRRAAIARDDVVAPLATQPDTLASDDDSIYLGNYIRLRRPEVGGQAGACPWYHVCANRRDSRSNPRSASHFFLAGA